MALPSQSLRSRSIHKETQGTMPTVNQPRGASSSFYNPDGYVQVQVTNLVVAVSADGGSEGGLRINKYDYE